VLRIRTAVPVRLLLRDIPQRQKRLAKWRHSNAATGPDAACAGRIPPAAAARRLSTSTAGTALPRSRRLCSPAVLVSTCRTWCGVLQRERSRKKEKEEKKRTGLLASMFLRRPQLYVLVGGVYCFFSDGFSFFSFPSPLCHFVCVTVCAICDATITLEMRY